MLNWWQLRAVGNLKFLKAIYLILLVVPLLSKHRLLADFIGIPRWFLATTFFGSVFLALANLLYDIRCPTIVKRFASPNDLYFQMLKIKSLSIKYYPGDNFDASLQHCVDSYTKESNSAPISRFFCSALFIGSAILFGMVLGYRFYVVTMFFLELD